MKLSTPNKNNNKGNNNIDKIQKQKVVISEKKEINNNKTEKNIKELQTKKEDKTEIKLIIKNNIKSPIKPDDKKNEINKIEINKSDKSEIIKKDNKEIKEKSKPQNFGNERIISEEIKINNEKENLIQQQINILDKNIEEKEKLFLF